MGNLCFLFFNLARISILEFQLGFTWILPVCRWNGFIGVLRNRLLHGSEHKTKILAIGNGWTPSLAYRARRADKYVRNVIYIQIVDRVFALRQTGIVWTNKTRLISLNTPLKGNQKKILAHRRFLNKTTTRTINPTK